MRILEAKRLLGHNLFCKALMEWDERTLLAHIHHPEAILSDADQAYQAIYDFRFWEDRPVAKVYEFHVEREKRRGRKAA